MWRRSCSVATAEPLITVRRDTFKNALATLRPDEAILGLRIFDPAMGSGHFLISLVEMLTDHVFDATAEVAVAGAKLDYRSPLLRDRRHHLQPGQPGLGNTSSHRCKRSAGQRFYPCSAFFKACRVNRLWGIPLRAAGCCALSFDRDRAEAPVLHSGQSVVLNQHFLRYMPYPGNLADHG